MEERSFSISLTSLQKLFVAWEYQNFYYYLMYFLNPKSFVKSFLEIFFVKKMRRSNLHFSKDIFSDFQTAKSAHFSPITFSREKAFLKAFLKVSSTFLCDAFQWVLLACALCLAAFTAKVHLAFLHNIYREETLGEQERTLSFLHLFVSCHLCH